jgi:protein-disulfide isomerase
MEKEKKLNMSELSTPMAIVIAGVLIAGAVYFSSVSKNTQVNNPGNGNAVLPTNLVPVGKEDRTLGDPNAKVTLVMYEDFQCPWCEKFDTESEQAIRNTYVKDGKVQLVFRDFPFLGDRAKSEGKEDESTKAAEAARCAEDQGKFWEYHDYLFAHQNGESQGAFSVKNLKSFAQTLGLDKTSFNQCLDSDKYAKAVLDSKNAGADAGVQGTPKGFILKKGKVVDTIDGYVPLQTVTQKIDNALK